MAAGANYHRLSGFKEQKCILSHFGGQKNFFSSSLTNYTCKNPIFKQSHVLKFQVHMYWGGALFSPVQPGTFSSFKMDPSCLETLISVAQT